MTNSIPANTAAAIATRDAAETNTPAGHRGRPLPSDSRDLGFSFRNILHQGGRIESTVTKASMGLAPSVAEDSKVSPEFDTSSPRPSRDDDAPTSEVDTVDDRRDWEARDRTRDQNNREPDGPTSNPKESAADELVRLPAADDPGLAGSPAANAGNKRSESAPAVKTSDAGTGHGPSAKDVADPVGSQAKAQQPTPAQSNDDGAELRPKARVVADQANELAKSLPAGGGHKINVTVAKPGDALFSQPASSLAAASVTNTQNSGSRPGQVALGAVAQVGPAPPFNPGQGQAAARQVDHVKAGSGPGDAQLQTGGRGNTANLAGAQPRSAGTSAHSPAGPFADITGIGSSGTPQAGQRAASSPGPTPGTPTSPQPAVAEQISVQIAKAAKAGIDRIDIQLKPKELGRVDVRLELTGDGRVSATVTVDNRETLELLKTDARGLEKALDSAGLKADSSSLNFNLRGQDGRSSGNQLSQWGHSGESQSEDDTTSGGDISTRTLGDYSRGGISADGSFDIEI